MNSSVSMQWIAICAVTDIPLLGSRVVARPEPGKPAIALFRTANDSVFALLDQCPHKKGPLSQGIVHGTHVTCPLHAWTIGLKDGQALSPDEGCTARFTVHVSKGMVHLDLAELQA